MRHAEQQARAQALGKVGVLYGGYSAEREVSLMSGAGVHAALLEAGVDAHLVDLAHTGLPALAAAGFDRVFLALHGRYGEDGCLQGVLEWLRLPYTGSGVASSALAMDKVMTKRVWQQHGLATPDFVVLDDATLEGDVLAARLGLPFIVKPASEGSTLGLTKVTDPAQLPEARGLASRYEAHALAEAFVAGRELTVAILGDGAAARALPVVEIRAPDGNYDFQSKYYSDDTRYVCPAELSEATTTEVQQLALAAYRAVGCHGWGRVDVMLDAHERPWLLEVNTSPGMTSHSLVPMAARADGIDYPSLCVMLLEGARCKVSAGAAWQPPGTEARG